MAAEWQQRFDRTLVEKQQTSGAASIPITTSSFIFPPLIFLMHGFTGSALGISSYSGMNALADEYGFVVCYPQGTSDQNGNNFWN